jgi:hypothetical protein
LVEAVASVAGYFSGLIALVAGGYVAAHVHQLPDRRILRAYLAGALCFLGMSVIITAPATLDLTTPIDVLPNLTRMIGNIAAMCAAWSVLAMLIHTLYRGRRAQRLVRQHAAALLVLVIAMIALLSLAHTHTTDDFAVTYAKDLPAIGYEVINISYMATGMIGLLWLLRRYVPQQGVRNIRGALHANVIAALGGLMWACWKFITVGLVEAGLAPIPNVNAISELIAAVFISIAGAGCTLPAWLGWLGHHLDRVRSRLAYRRLDPMWTTLTGMVPQVALGADRQAGIDFALHRRGIEIRDAQLALRRHVAPSVRTAAVLAAREHHIPPGEDTELFVEAAELRAAIAGHRAGTVYAVEGILAESPPTSPAPQSEIRWLLALSHELFTNPLIEEIARTTIRHHSPREADVAVDDLRCDGRFDVRGTPPPENAPDRRADRRTPH